MSQDDETRVFAAGSGGEDHDALVGSVLAGRYEIERLLGVGAMGAVYLGRHLKINRRDAIKILHPDQARDPDAIARFDRGARNVGAIRHPNVCTIYDFSDTESGVQYLAMEFVDGEALTDVLKREGKLPAERALHIGEQVAAALQAAHDADIVHRDLKPGNIMVSRGRDASDAIKVVDFDISKGSRDGIDPEVTRVGFVVGTPEYMSPEQLWGGELDGRSDVYSMALVIYRMLTGTLPFRGESMQETMNARLTDAPLLRLEELAPEREFPAGLQDILDRALKCKPADRTASAAAFGAELKALRGGGDTGEIPATVVASRGSGTGTPASASAQGGTAAALSTGRRVVMAAGAVLVLGLGALGAAQVLGGSGDAAAGEEALGLLAGDSTGDGAGSPVDPQGTDGAGDGAANPDDGAGSGTGDVASNRASAQTNRAGSAPAGTDGRNPERSGPPATPLPGPAAADAGRVLGRYRDLLATAPPSSSITLRAMRDTAALYYDLTGVSASDRGLAAFIAGNISVSLEEPEACSTWADRAERAGSSLAGVLRGMCGATGG